MSAQSPLHLQDSYPKSFRRDSHLASRQDPCIALESPVTRGEEGDEQFFREMLESVADGIYGLDVNGFVTFMNPAARRMTGWSIEDLCGRTQHSMVHHSHADGSAYPREECPIYAALRDGMVHRREDEVFWRKDGSSFPIGYTSSPIFRDGRPDGAIVIFRPLDSQRRRSPILALSESTPTSSGEAAR